MTFKLSPGVKIWLSLGCHKFYIDLYSTFKYRLVGPKPYSIGLLNLACSFIKLPSTKILNPFPNKLWFLHVCSASLLKTLWEKEKLLVTSNFSFSPSFFYRFGELSAFFIKLEIVVCKPSQLR